jgi:hypothetical protein
MSSQQAPILDTGWQGFSLHGQLPDPRRLALLKWDEFSPGGCRAKLLANRQRVRETVAYRGELRLHLRTIRWNLRLGGGQVEQ